MNPTPEKQDKATPRAEFALGIVTRMGRNPEGFGGEAIEPGPEGKRPALTAQEVAGYRTAAHALRYMSQFPEHKANWFAYRVAAIRLERLADEAVSAADAGRRARAAHCGGSAVPLGNTGTTTGEGA